MDRELLLEIGCEELPASWLLPLSRQLGERLAAELVTFRISAGALGRDARDAAPPDGRRSSRISERQTDLDEQVTGPPVARRVRPRRPAHAGRDRLRAQARQRRAVGADGRRDAEGQVPLLRQARARQGDGRRAAGRARRDAARPVVPEADALGRLARRRQGRADVRPPDPLDSLPARRPRRAVRDPPQRRSRSRRRSRTCAPAP